MLLKILKYVFDQHLNLRPARFFRFTQSQPFADNIQAICPCFIAWVFTIVLLEEFANDMSAF